MIGRVVCAGCKQTVNGWHFCKETGESRKVREREERARLRARARGSAARIGNGERVQKSLAV